MYRREHPTTDWHTPTNNKVKGSPCNWWDQARARQLGAERQYATSWRSKSTENNLKRVRIRRDGGTAVGGPWMLLTDTQTDMESPQDEFGELRCTHRQTWTPHKTSSLNFVVRFVLVCGGLLSAQQVYADILGNLRGIRLSVSVS